jgi:predicted N-formylglutamate amidohydrolase
MPVDRDESSDVVRAGSSSAVLFTCEHGAEQLPAPWAWPESDAWLRGTHWAYDPGAADLSRELARALDTVAVIARFTRLLADPNRPEDSPDLFRRAAEGRPVALNAAIDSAERERRLAWWRGYHAAVDREVRASPALVVFSVHTFTPVFDGVARPMEAGVLFDEEEALAHALRDALAATGFRVAMNEPYSGKLGLMYSVDRHARAHGRRAIELELRQDLSVDPGARRRVVGAVARLFRAGP